MNPGWYDSVLAFQKLVRVDWGTNLKKIREDDLVMIYHSKPEKTIRLITKVVKTSVKRSELINDGKFIKSAAPPRIRNGEGKNIVRLELVDFIGPEYNLDCASIRRHYNGCFGGKFCIDRNKELNNYILDKLRSGKSRRILELWSD